MFYKELTILYDVSEYVVDLERILNRLLHRNPFRPPQAIVDQFIRLWFYHHLDEMTLFLFIERWQQAYEQVDPTHTYHSLFMRWCRETEHLTPMLYRGTRVPVQLFQAECQDIRLSRQRDLTIILQVPTDYAHHPSYH